VQDRNIQITNKGKVMRKLNDNRIIEAVKKEYPKVYFKDLPWDMLELIVSFLPLNAPNTTD